MRRNDETMCIHDLGETFQKFADGREAKPLINVLVKRVNDIICLRCGWPLLKMRVRLCRIRGVGQPSVAFAMWRCICRFMASPHIARQTVGH
jgi:hypothetical protein